MPRNRCGRGPARDSVVALKSFLAFDVGSDESAFPGVEVRQPLGGRPAQGIRSADDDCGSLHPADDLAVENGEPAVIICCPFRPCAADFLQLHLCGKAGIGDLTRDR